MTLKPSSASTSQLGLFEQNKETNGANDFGNAPLGARSKKAVRISSFLPAGEEFKKAGADRHYFFKERRLALLQLAIRKATLGIDVLRELQRTTKCSEVPDFAIIESEGSCRLFNFTNLLVDNFSLEIDEEVAAQIALYVADGSQAGLIRRFEEHSVRLDSAWRNLKDLVVLCIKEASRGSAKEGRNGLIELLSIVAYRCILQSSQSDGEPNIATNSRKNQIRQLFSNEAQFEDLPRVRAAQKEALSGKNFRIINSLMDHLRSSLTPENLSGFELSALPSYCFCYAFEGIIETIENDDADESTLKSRKKGSGVFYTPHRLAAFVASETIIQHVKNGGDLKNIKIADIAMGSGIFLISAHKQLERMFVLRGEPLNAARTLKSLFGSDINERAVDIARLVLWHSSKLKKYPQSLSKNLRACDALTLPPTPYDILLGNPPWGADLPSTVYEQFSNCRAFYNKKIKNSYKLFYFKYRELLSKTGSVGVLIPSTSILQDEYYDIRKEILSYGSARIVDLGTGTFKDAIVQTSIHFLYRAKGAFEGLALRELRTESDRLEALHFHQNNFFPLGIREHDGHPRFQLKGPNDKPSLLMDNLDHPNIFLLSDFAAEMTKGVEPGCVAAFLVDDQTFPFSEFVRPIREGKDIHKGRVLKPRCALINLNGLSEAKIPKALLRHLSNYSRELKARSKVKAGSIAWYELNSCKTPALFSKESILVRRTSDSVIAALNDGCQATNGLHVITLKSQYAHLAPILTEVLNSEEVNAAYQKISQEVGKTFAEVKAINLLATPVPNLELMLELRKKHPDKNVSLLINECLKGKITLRKAS